MVMSVVGAGYILYCKYCPLHNNNKAKKLKQVKLLCDRNTQTNDNFTAPQEDPFRTLIYKLASKEAENIGAKVNSAALKYS